MRRGGIMLAQISVGVSPHPVSLRSPTVSPQPARAHPVASALADLAVSVGV
jgi:hypothetical protein